MASIHQGELRDDSTSASFETENGMAISLRRHIISWRSQRRNDDYLIQQQLLHDADALCKLCQLNRRAYHASDNTSVACGINNAEEMVVIRDNFETYQGLLFCRRTRQLRCCELLRKRRNQLLRDGGNGWSFDRDLHLLLFICQRMFRGVAFRPGPISGGLWGNGGSCGSTVARARTRRRAAGHGLHFTRAVERSRCCP